VRLVEEPAVALRPAKRAAGDAEAEAGLVGDDISDSVTVARLGDQRSAVAPDHRPRLRPCAGLDVHFSGGKDETRRLRRLALRQDQGTLTRTEPNPIAAA